MKSIFLLILVSIIGQPGISQTKTEVLDSLIATATSDTGRIHLKLRKQNSLNNRNLDSGIMYGLALAKEAAAVNFLKGEGEALCNVGFAYSLKGRYDLARKMLSDAARIADQLKDSLLFATLYATYGSMYGIQGKYDSSILYLEKAISISEALKAVDDLKTFYGNIAIGYQQTGDFPKALSYQIKSLKLAEEANNVISQAFTLLNMGITYTEMEDFGKAEKYMVQAIEKAKAADLLNVQLYGASNLASVYQHTKNWQKSYNYAMEAATLAVKTGDKGIESASLSKAAEALASLKQYAQAEVLANKAIKLADASQQPINIFQTYNTLGNVLIMESRYRQSLPYYKKAESAGAELDMYNTATALFFKNFSLSYEKTGNFPEALKRYKKSAEITDSIRRKENVMKATTLSMNYEFEKKQAREKISQNKKDAAAKMRLLALSGTAGVILILALGSWVALRGKQKANRKLREKNAEIRDTLRKLRETQFQLIQSEKMASMGELTAGIAHEIQNPLNFVNNFSDVNGELISELLEERRKGVRNIQVEEDLLKDIKENEARINFHGKRADAIVKSMLQHSRKSTGQKELTNINSLADEYLRLSYHGLRARDKSFNVTMETDYDDALPKINVMPQEIGRVFLNLFNNAFYAISLKRKNDAHFDPIIKVTTASSPEWAVVIKITDNGVGISKDILDKIFQPFFTTKPTKEGTGLGLSLSYDIVKAHDGKFVVNTEEGEFTEFVISLPAG